MREIKFRAWDKKYNFMIPPEDIHPRVMEELITGEGKVLEVHESFSYSGTTMSFDDISDSRILMQFTGSKDKNGREIYEGDIVKAFNKIHDDTERDNKVIFSNGSFRLSVDEKYVSDIPLGNYRASELEVIGNIYVNPELLEV